MKGFAFVAVVCALVAMAFAMQSKTMMAESEIVDVAYCMNNCSYPVGGYCNPNFGCVCNAGYAGPDCSVGAFPMWWLCVVCVSYRAFVCVHFPDAETSWI